MLCGKRDTIYSALLVKSFAFKNFPPAPGGMSPPPASFSSSRRNMQIQGSGLFDEETSFATKTVPASNEESTPRHDDPASEALLAVHRDVQDLRHEHRSSYKGSYTLRNWCYVLHGILVIIHVVLVAMLFRHPEHRVTVPANSTILTVGLSAFLQAFYTILHRCFSSHHATPGGVRCPSQTTETHNHT
ncbi:hypothetical protein BDN67DRAFT_262108 [Paxillus ammoniavirescens]|nr:hypothetical protein BDN67DRAFT_262108 [Paxillus ammoniavirescens]